MDTGTDDDNDYSGRKPSKFQLERESEERRERISDQNINSLLKQSTQLAKALSSREGSLASLNQSMENGSMIAELKLGE